MSWWDFIPSTAQRDWEPWLNLENVMSNRTIFLKCIVLKIFVRFGAYVIKEYVICFYLVFKKLYYIKYIVGHVIQNICSQKLINRSENIKELFVLK